jgi:hypothetical protein
MYGPSQQTLTASNKDGQLWRQRINLFPLLESLKMSITFSALVPVLKRLVSPRVETTLYQMTSLCGILTRAGSHQRTLHENAPS